ncbi:MAG: hypothetical protein U0271_44095 [Polyangiaceae bacterium]
MTVRRWVAALSFALAALPGRFAAAEETDGSYGRIEGDLLMVGSVGCAIADGGPELESHVSLLYLSTAGLYARYVETFGNDAAPFSRVLGLGVELRPLFLGRFAKDLEHGPAVFDLFLDSLSLFVGATWRAARSTGFDTEPGLELGVGLETPLMGRASGPYLGVLALARFHPRDLAHGSNSDLLDRGSAIVLTFAWHQVVSAHLVDARDPNATP